jgi:protoporphyrin/coproporphyrin ferrochelatase
MKIEVLLVSYAGPRTIDEIPAFLRKMLGNDVPPSMLKTVQSRYIAIGGCSPLSTIMDTFAEKLSDKLAFNGVCRPAFLYTIPLIEEQIESCVSSGAEAIICFIMTPFYASETVGKYIETVNKHLAKLSKTPIIEFIHSWYDEPRFVSAWVNKLRRELPESGFFLLFTAHSLPITQSSKLYASQIEETVNSITSQLGISTAYQLAWQSIPDRRSEPWVSPSVEQAIEGLSNKMRSCIIEVPIGFVSDHLETLYDIDIVHRNFALQQGFCFSRISSMNLDALFVDAVRFLIQRRIQGLLTNSK